ncbi:hypothetical protein, partial [Candidatus Hakubella thermalkaliphila]
RSMVRQEINKITAGIEVSALHSVMQDREFMSKLAEKNIVVPYFAEFLKIRKVRKFPAGQATPYHEGIGRIAAQAAITGELTVDEALVELQKFIDPLIEGKE